MRHLVMILMAVLFLSAPARADETAIRSVISSQIEAFQADDFTTAFAYASPTIRQIFKTPENFGTMVRQGYPMVWRPAETNFLSVEVIDGLLWQNVMIRDQAGGAAYPRVSDDRAWGRVEDQRGPPAQGA